MKLECSYCKNQLTKGFINSGRYSFKWHNEDAGFLEVLTVFGGEVLSEKNKVDCYRCKKCNKIIIDIDEL